MSFLTRSVLVLLALYGMVFAFGTALLNRLDAPMWVPVTVTLLFVVAQYLLAPAILEWVYSIDWDSSKIPAENREFVERLCAERGLPMPRLGIIHSDTPNAFSFGQLRSDTRVVITEGLLKGLTPAEANAVLAHEVGHIAHYDFAVMTLAAAAPLVLYQMYVWGRGVKQIRAIAWGAYAAYLLGQFLVLTLNRTREYWADHFSAECTHAPGELSSALVKIAYGMVRVDGEQRRVLASGTDEEKKDARRAQQFGGAIALMGIANLNSAQSLALALANPQQATAVMRWDLVNPWARVYELNSTHPLTALRVQRLNVMATALHQPEAYPLPLEPGGSARRWSAFPLEFFFWATPVLLGTLLVFDGVVSLFLAKFGLHLPQHYVPLMLTALGVTWMGRIAFRYRGTFQPKQVLSLLQDLEVSQMTPRAVEMRGRIVGNGMPGVYWSPDLMLQDETGMMFVLYRSSIPFARLLFALRDADSYTGEEVVLKGWYRRGLRPYVELAEITAEVPVMKGDSYTGLFNGSSGAPAMTRRKLHQRSYSRWIQFVGSAACVAAGLWLL